YPPHEDLRRATRVAIFSGFQFRNFVRKVLHSEIYCTAPIFPELSFYISQCDLFRSSDQPADFVFYERIIVVPRGWFVADAHRQLVLGKGDRVVDFPRADLSRISRKSQM